MAPNAKNLAAFGSTNDATPVRVAQNRNARQRTRNTFYNVARLINFPPAYNIGAMSVMCVY